MILRMKSFSEINNSADKEDYKKQGINDLPAPHVFFFLTTNSLTHTGNMASTIIYNII